MMDALDLGAAFDVVNSGLLLGIFYRLGTLTTAVASHNNRLNKLEISA